MPIVDIQKQMREIGRIRTGNQVRAKNSDRMIPNKLATFRLTSPREALIAAAARVYGGEVHQWDNDGALEFEVIIDADSMPIVVPPGQVVSQWMELWSGGGCLRRCDGITNSIDGQPCGSTPSQAGQKTIPPCPQTVPERVAAANKGLACKTTTRLSVILPELPDLGVWRLESHGYNAAVHITGAANILAMATDRGMLIPARLRLEEHSKKVPGEGTRKWYEPVIEFTETTFAELGITGPSAPQLTSGRPAAPPLPQIAAPASSDFRATPALTGDIIEHVPAEPATAPPVAGTCGWSLRPPSGPDEPCAFDAQHDSVHSWHERRAGGRVVPPA